MCELTIGHLGGLGPLQIFRPLPSDGKMICHRSANIIENNLLFASGIACQCWKLHTCSDAKREVDRTESQVSIPLLISCVHKVVRELRLELGYTYIYGVELTVTSHDWK